MKKHFFAFFVTVLFAMTHLTSKEIPSPANQPNTLQSLTDTISWVTSYTEAVTEAKSSDKPILILFTGTTWCPACKLLEKNVLVKPSFASAVGNQFVFLKAEIPYTSSNSPYTSLLNRYNINEFPSIVIVNPSGNELFRVSYHGNVGEESYAQELLQKLKTTSS